MVTRQIACVADRSVQPLHNRSMDDIVERALAKWPNVPACHGWLGLDQRGCWYLRDAMAQAQGGFAQVRGERLSHRGLIEFIGRNYLSDVDGQWYFQNGPQRVYVELEVTPWVWRVTPDGGLTSHTGLAVRARQILCDERGWLYVDTVLGLGLVHSLDVVIAADLFDRGIWCRPEEVRAADLAGRFRFVTSPQKAVRRR